MSTTEITIQGLKFDAPQPYAAGHVLTENEASALNQTFAENLRNNFAKTVKDAVAEAAKSLDVAEDQIGADELDMEDLKAEFAEYASTYKFGVRAGGTRGPSDPIGRAMLQIAKDRVIAHLAKKGVARGSLKASEITEMAREVLKNADKAAAIRTLAEAQVKAALSISMDDLDLNEIAA